MNFIQKVYYNDKPIIVTNDPEIYKGSNVAAAGFQVLSVFNDANFDMAKQMLDKKDNGGIIIKEESSVTLVKHLDKLFKIIQAGGGLVANEKNELLLIFRRGKWDLPKGKLDKGESIDQCALREVREETGIRQLKLGDKIAETWHLYNEKNKNIVKHTTWFRMTASDAEKLQPQAEEDILEVKWVNPAALAPFMGNTYSAIKDVMRMAGMNW